MRNIHAFLKHNYLKQNIPLKSISMSVGLDSGYISKILNNKLPLPKERNLKKLCLSLHISNDLLLIDNHPIYTLFDQFMETVYSINIEKREKLYKNIKNNEKNEINSPIVLTIHLTEVIFKSCLNTFDSNFYSSLNVLLPIANSLDPFEHKLFLMFYANYLKQKQQFNESLLALEEAKRIIVENKNLDMLIIYYELMINKSNYSLSQIKTFYELFELYKKFNNINRFINLKIIFSGYLMEMGYIREALENSMELYNEYYKSGKIKKNLATILNNIAWYNLLLKDYPNALVYYLKVIEYNQDSDLYFNISWCYYCLNQNSESKKYINLGKKSSNKVEVYYLLLEWLDAMLQKKYSKKSYSILLKISKEYINTLPKFEQNLIYFELANYYKANKMMGEYAIICEKYLNSIPSITQLH